MEFDKRVQNYWNVRSKEFGDTRRVELAGPDAQAWQNFITSYLPKKKDISVLDVGTGTGFLAILMAQSGYCVTGIDLSKEMLRQAEQAAQMNEMSIHFECGNAQQLDFASNTFEVVVSRNLTWNLPNVTAAYIEWLRVLKPGGIMLNFDSNYGAINFATEAEKKENVHHKLDKKILWECENLKKGLSISQENRPQWDLQCLQRIGFVNCSYRADIRSMVHCLQNMQYDTLPLFSLCGYKSAQRNM